MFYIICKKVLRNLQATQIRTNQLLHNNKRYTINYCSCFISFIKVNFDIDLCSNSGEHSSVLMLIVSRSVEIMAQ